CGIEDRLAIVIDANRPAVPMDQSINRRALGIPLFAVWLDLTVDRHDSVSTGVRFDPAHEDPVFNIHVRAFQPDELADPHAGVYHDQYGPDPHIAGLGERTYFIDLRLAECWFFRFSSAGEFDGPSVVGRNYVIVECDLE